MLEAGTPVKFSNLDAFRRRATLFHIHIPDAARPPRRRDHERSLLLVVQHAAEGDGKVAIAVVHLVHGPGRQGLAPLLREDRQLLRLVAEVGDPYPEEPDRLLQGEAVEDADRFPVDFLAAVGVLAPALLSAEGG